MSATHYGPHLTNSKNRYISVSLYGLCLYTVTNFQEHRKIMSKRRITHEMLSFVDWNRSQLTPDIERSCNMYFTGEKYWIPYEFVVLFCCVVDTKFYIADLCDVFRHILGGLGWQWASWAKLMSHILGLYGVTTIFIFNIHLAFLAIQISCQVTNLHNSLPTIEMRWYGEHCKYEQLIAFTTWWDVFNILRPIQNGLHLPDAIFRCIYVDENQ